MKNTNTITPTNQKFTPIFATEDAFVRYDNFHCGYLERVPVYFMNQGRRLFVCNMPNEYKTRDSHIGLYDFELKEGRQDVENYFSQLNANGGKYFKFYTVNHKDKTLPEFLEWIKANGYTFNKNMTDFSIEKDYIDFSGNLNEYSAAFCFRIYDKDLATHLMNTIDAPRRDYTKE